MLIYHEFSFNRVWNRAAEKPFTRKWRDVNVRGLTHDVRCVCACIETWCAAGDAPSRRQSLQSQSNSRSEEPPLTCSPKKNGYTNYERDGMGGGSGRVGKKTMKGSKTETPSQPSYVSIEAGCVWMWHGDGVHIDVDADVDVDVEVKRVLWRMYVTCFCSIPLIKCGMTLNHQCTRKQAPESCRVDL